MIAAAVFCLAPMARRRTHATNAKIAYQGLPFASSALGTDAPTEVYRLEAKSTAGSVSALREKVDRGAAVERGAAGFDPDRFVERAEFPEDRVGLVEQLPRRRQVSGGLAQ